MVIAQLFLKQWELEAKATRTCLERIPSELADWKPHEKSMPLGYLALLVADMPKWISVMITVGEINFATWEKYTDLPLENAVAIFDANMELARKSLQGATDEKLEQGMFVLKAGEQELMKTPLIESLAQTLSHFAHHRGQLTVYMRLNNIPVPAIYGPSADDKSF